MSAATALANGFLVKTYPVPPASFDLEKATDDERLQYGLPRLSPGLNAVVKHLIAARQGFRYIEPVFKPRDRMRKRLPGIKLVHGVEKNPIWSGVVAFPPKNDRMDGVWSTWKMPDDSLPSGGHDGIWYTASTWVGIDGDDGSGDVVQTGCDADVMNSNGSTQHQFNPWWEWYPAASFWLTSFPVSPGDRLNALVIAVPGDPAVAIFQLINFSQFGFSFYSITAPAGVSFQGNCAEWIVEALETGPGNAPELAKFNTVKFTECGAHTLGDKVVSATGGTIEEIVNSGGAVLAKGKAVSATEVEVEHV